MDRALCFDSHVQMLAARAPVRGLPPQQIPFVFVVRERLSTSNENGGYHEHVLLRTNFV